MFSTTDPFVVVLGVFFDDIVNGVFVFSLSVSDDGFSNDRFVLSSADFNRTVSDWSLVLFD